MPLTHTSVTGKKRDMSVSLNPGRAATKISAMHRWIRLSFMMGLVTTAIVSAIQPTMSSPRSAPGRSCEIDLAARPRSREQPSWIVFDSLRGVGCAVGDELTIRNVPAVSDSPPGHWQDLFCDAAGGRTVLQPNGRLLVTCRSWSGARVDR